MTDLYEPFFKERKLPNFVKIGPNICLWHQCNMQLMLGFILISSP